QGGVDARVDGVGLEVEYEGRFLRSARFSTAAPAAHQSREGDGRQQRGHPSHERDRIRGAVADDRSDELLAFIEIPKGGRNKYEYDENLGRLVLDRFLSSSTVYPVDYGYLIGHR